MSDRHNDILRTIPSVDELLSNEALEHVRADHPQVPWTRLVRRVVDDLRAAPPELTEVHRAATTAWIVGEVERRVSELRHGGLRRVLNGTGVVLHTNLGRAVLSEAAADAGREAFLRYVTLEVDVESGRRDRRAQTLDDLILLATGADACMVVNNNAAAVYLVASSVEPPGRVIVSRGELVEIGGSFRLPEILRHAAHEVVEVGTTNRTYADDYRRMARPGDLILKVHKSNYAIEGFAHEATIDELAGVAAEVGCDLAYDLGSGAVFDFAAAGVGEDPGVAAVVARGVDCVTMSGDKLMGGPQAGVIAGRTAFIERLKRNPLRRAVRVDKVTVAVLQQVMREYLFSVDPRAGVPSLERIFTPVETLRARAQAVAEGLGGNVAVSVVDDDAAVGGGSLTSVRLPSAAVALSCRSEDDATALARRLRLQQTPLFTRIRGGEVRVNMMSIGPDEDADLRRALETALGTRES